MFFFFLRSHLAPCPPSMILPSFGSSAVLTLWSCFWSLFSVKHIAILSNILQYSLLLPYITIIEPSLIDRHCGGGGETLKRWNTLMQQKWTKEFKKVDPKFIIKNSCIKSYFWETRLVIFMYLGFTLQYHTVPFYISPFILINFKGMLSIDFVISSLR